MAADGTTRSGSRPWVHAKPLPLFPPVSNPHLPSLKPLEGILLDAMFDKRGFMCHFVVGERFADETLSQLLLSLYSAPETLSSAFVACSGKIFSRIDIGFTERDASLDYANSAKAVRALRKASIQDPLRGADLILAVTLGLGVVTFDLLDGGLHAHSVCQFTLRLVESVRYAELPVSSMLSTSRELYASLIPLVFLDTCNCIVRRELPVVKLPALGANFVDRYVGICVPLLPHMYDICYLNNQLYAHEATSVSADLACFANRKKLEEKVLGTYATILSWEPVVPDSFASLSTPREMETLVAQAEVFRYAMLLILHRIRFAFGTHDDVARALSAAIMRNIARIYRHSTSSENCNATVEPYEYRLGLPFLVASIELDDVDERRSAMQRAQIVVSGQLYPHISEMLTRFLLYIWEIRDVGCRDHWFDLVSGGPLFVLF